MLTLRARAAFSFAIALAVAGCVEVEVRRTLAPDHSGRETLTVRAPKSARADAFPGLFSGGTCQPPATQADGDRVTRTAEVAFPDVAAFRHQAGFLASAATVGPTADGAVAYRETLTNSYRRNIERAPSDEARQRLAAEMDEAKKALAAAVVTYTIQFPAPVAKSNADRISGSEATWVLDAEKLFAGRTVELTAEYRTAPPPALAVAAPPAGMVPLAAPVAPRPPEPPADRRQVRQATQGVPLSAAPRRRGSACARPGGPRVGRQRAWRR